MLKAVLEGIAFNHRAHVDALRDGFDVREARLTGGVSRNPLFAQMFADILNMPVTVPAIDEAAAFGAALCAGAAIGLFASPHPDPNSAAAKGKVYFPDAARSAALGERFSLYCRLAESLKAQWPAIERLAQLNPDRPS
jgi:L-xylulokinase